MSQPECPPFNPLTVTLNAVMPEGTLTSLYLSIPFALVPPAHPINNWPSSSESRFINISPFSRPGFKPNAPVIPVSSSTVKSASIGPCSISFDSSTASAVATPIPLSPPRVVPVAFTQPSTMRGLIGSFRKSCSTSEFFCGTMSR